MPSNCTFVTSTRQFGLDSLASSVASVSNLYPIPKEELNHIKTALISDAFKYPYHNNAYYREACDSKGVHPDQIVSFADLLRIPLVPIAKFQIASSHERLSKPQHAIEHEMHSTGTSGLTSISRRCSVTGRRRRSSDLSRVSRCFQRCGSVCLPFHGGDPRNGNNQALNMHAGLIDAHRFLVKQERFVPEDALLQLKTWENQFTRHVVGPPFLIYSLLQFLQQTGQRIKLDRGRRIVTLGGWKGFTGQMISRREINLICQEYLGLEPNGVRDIGALVPSNLMTINNWHLIKHVSPYLHLTVRDMNNLSKEVLIGEKGALSNFDHVYTRKELYAKC